MQKQTCPTPNIECVKNVELLFNYERQFFLKGREDNFEKRLGLMIDYYEE